MSYKPTNEQLLAYLYGELDADEFQRISDYLEAHPEERAKLQELSETRMIFNELDDEEIPSPIVVQSEHVHSEWSYWRKYVAVAATLLLLMTFGWLTGFGLHYDDEGLALGYTTIQKGLTEAQVAGIIEEDRGIMMDYMRSYMTNMSDSLNSNLQVLQASMTNEDLIKEVVANEKQKLMNDMIAVSDQLSDDYREIMRQLIVSFSNNYQSQRIEDLNSIQAALTNLEDATYNRQVELEDELVNLATQLDAVIVSLNNR